MASFTLLTLLLCLFTFSSDTLASSQMIDETTTSFNHLIMSDTLDWPTPTTKSSSLYHDNNNMVIEDSVGDDEEEDIENGYGRRSLFWRRMKYYISYGALSANRIPCPPRSGRSYYTHQCYKARGPVHPYSRGCSAITRCRR